MNRPVPASAPARVLSTLALALAGGLEAQSVPAGMVLIKAKGLSFDMGMATSEYRTGDPWAHYENKHKVTFTYDFYLDTTLVSQGDWVAMMGVNPSQNKTGGNLRLPVEKVSYYDAVLYLNAKSRKEGLDTAYAYRAVTRSASGSASNMTEFRFNLKSNGYRLPTNAEQEYATRATATGTYPWAVEQAEANRIGGDYAWWQGNSGNLTHPVGTKKPNAWGLYDMVGNLFEWCYDFDAAYPTAEDVDPVGAATGTARVAKGGSFRNDITGHMRIKYHYKWAPASTHYEVGFRGARTAPPSTGIAPDPSGRALPAESVPRLIRGGWAFPARGTGSGSRYDAGGRLIRGSASILRIDPVPK